MTTVTLVSGDDIDFVVQLTKSNAVFVIDPAATVKALLRSDGVALTAEVPCNRLASGANWPSSLVVASFDSTVTDKLVKRHARPRNIALEIQVTEAGKTTTWIVSPIQLEVGLITQ